MTSTQVDAHRRPLAWHRLAMLGLGYVMLGFGFGLGLGYVMLELGLGSAGACVTCGLVWCGRSSGDAALAILAIRSRPVAPNRTRQAPEPHH